MPDPGDGLELEGPHWAFALDLYHRRGVAEACLRLQDDLDADVTLLLFALYTADQHHRALRPAEIAALDATVAPWRAEVVQPLRALRRRMRNGPSPAACAATEALRDRIKAAEVGAEQIELAAMAQWLQSNPLQAASDPVDIAALLDRLAAFFAARTPSASKAQSPAIASALQTIALAVAAAFQRR